MDLGALQILAVNGVRLSHPNPQFLCKMGGNTICQIVEVGELPLVKYMAWGP